MLQQEFSRTNPFISFRAPDGTPHVLAEPSIFAEYVWFPLYDWLLQFIPKGVKPNWVTLFGIGSTLLSSLLMLASMVPGTLFEPAYGAWMPTFGPTPEETYTGPLLPHRIQPVLPFLSVNAFLFLCGFLTLIYCVADNIDGRLARRDQHFSLVGEYLDHSLDCVTSLLSTGVVFCSMGASTGNMATMMTFIAFITIISHTMHFEQNIFVWGNRYMSVDEAMIFFGVGTWIPIAFPTIGTMQMPFSSLVTDTFPWFAGFRVVDFLYFIAFATQVSTLIGLVKSRPGLLIRLQSLFLVAVAEVLLSCIPAHCAAAAAAAESTVSSGWWKHWFGNIYTVGRFTYPAVWTITAATSYSTLIHTSIMARCAAQEELSYVPLIAVLATVVLFTSVPAAAMTWAVASHVCQIIWNVGALYDIKGRKKAKK